MCSIGNINNNIVTNLRGYWTYYSNQFLIYISIKPLCCTLETNNIVCQLYHNTFLRKRIQNYFKVELHHFFFFTLEFKIIIEI